MQHVRGIGWLLHGAIFMRQPLQIIGPRSELSTRARGRMLLV